MNPDDIQEMLNIIQDNSSSFIKAVAECPEPITISFAFWFFARGYEACLEDRRDEPYHIKL
ncbi:MAG TPA: hypothetical protein VHZ76_03315 [Gammaproteobacteria bacterium]|jgi:hypothetical protein|nr:hypothetical protein [Gammaproteobacteria bacterium]